MLFLIFDETIISNENHYDKKGGRHSISDIHFNFSCVWIKDLLLLLFTGNWKASVILAENLDIFINWNLHINYSHLTVQLHFLKYKIFYPGKPLVDFPECCLHLLWNVLKNIIKNLLLFNTFISPQMMWKMNLKHCCDIWFKITLFIIYST